MNPYLNSASRSGYSDPQTDRGFTLLETLPSRPRHPDAGESLVEILMTIMIIGLTVTALLSSLASAGNASNVHRSSVQGDYILRNFAAAAKASAQLCTPGAAFAVAYTPPIGFAVGGIALGSVCPGPATSPVPYVTPFTLTVVGPLGFHESLDVRVRTP
jgi:type II secretory pathway pseudopilin PulG